MNKEILITINGTDNKSISIPLEELSHTIIFGDTGSGKSNLLHMLITNLTKTYSSDKLKLALIDPKHVEFNSYKSLPHLFNTLARTPEELTAILDDCLNINTKTPIIIFIDELAELVFNNDALSKIISILNNDTNSNIYVIMATQRPVSIPDEIISKTKTQICFPLSQKKLPKSFPTEFTTAEHLNLGEMIFTNSTTKIQMQTAYINQATIDNIINKCKNKFKQKTLSVLKIKDGFDNGIYYIDGYEDGVFNWELLNLNDSYAKQSSKLIEQALNKKFNLEIFLVEVDDRFYISDGFKRLYAFISFLKNEYCLSDVDSKYEGKYFKDLTPKFQETIKSTPIDLIITKS